MPQTDKELFRIKPLEWKWLTINDIRFLNADSPVGDLNWRIYQLTDTWHLNPSGRSGIDCTSPEEGKQLAEKHWQDYIKQALVEVVDGCQP